MSQEHSRGLAAHSTPLRGRLHKLLLAGLYDNHFQMIQRNITWMIVLGVLLAILVLWVCSIYDLPQALFGVSGERGAIIEVWLETAWLLILLAGLLYAVRQFMHRIRYLEGFLPVCSFCKSIRVDDEWQSLERFLREKSNVVLSHSFCPACTRKHFGIETGHVEAPSPRRDQASGE
jgi:hypothetical protein